MKHYLIMRNLCKYLPPFSDIYEIFAFVRHIAPNATKLNNSRYNEQMFFYMLCVFCLYDIRRRKARAESDFGIKSVEIGALCPKKQSAHQKIGALCPKKQGAHQKIGSLRPKKWGALPNRWAHPPPKKVGRRTPEQVEHTPQKRKIGRTSDQFSYA